MVKPTPVLIAFIQHEWRKMKNTVIAVCLGMVVILAACQSSSTGTPVSTLPSTANLASSTPFPTATEWVTPQITATPFYGYGDGVRDAELWASYHFCVGQNEVGSSGDWDSSLLKFIEVNIQPDPNKLWVSEIADNLDNSFRAFVACEPDLCNNQIYVKDNKTGKVYDIDWKLKSTWRSIQQVQWVNYSTFVFYQALDLAHGQVVAINFDTKEYIYSAVAYPKSNCPIATPTITPLPSYPLKQILFNYTVTGFHTPYDMYFTDYDWSYFVLYTDGQLIIPNQQKMLSKDEINQFLAQLDALGFFTMDEDHRYNFGNQEPSKIFDGLFYCASVNGEKEHNLCVYEPYESFFTPETKNILQFLNDYRPEGMLPYYPDRILLWVQAGRSPYSTDLPKDSILWTETSLSLETTTEKVIYADGEIAKNLYLLYGDKQYVFIENGKEYTVSIQVILPHQELTNKYQ